MLPGLDPAFPLAGEWAYSEAQQRSYSVDSSDADFVDIVHTNIADKTIFKGLGQVAALGHVNFYVNDGMYQPDCIPSVYKGIIKNYIFNMGKKSSLNQISLT